MVEEEEAAGMGRTYRLSVDGLQVGRGEGGEGGKGGRRRGWSHVSLECGWASGGEGRREGREEGREGGEGRKEEDL